MTTLKEPAARAPETIDIPDFLPVLPIKDAVLFPYIILPLSVGRDLSLEAVDRALAEDRIVLVVAQRDPTRDEPEPEDLFRLGTAASIMRMLKLPDGRVRILVQGLARVAVEAIGRTEPFLQAKVRLAEDAPPPPDPVAVEALVRSAKENLDTAVSLGKGISSEVMVLSANLTEPGRLADLAASNLELSLEAGQELLETLDPIARLSKVNELLIREIQVLTMQHEITAQARGEMDRTQRDYFLRQQLKAIQEELGEGDELASEIAGYREAAKEKGMSAAAFEELERQIRRLERSHPESAETSIIRTYLEVLAGLPWTVTSDDDLDLDHAREVLDADHYGLEQVKERIIEYLAVRRLKPDARGPILCFVGPPGVGKTSLGRSVARALGRRFARLSLGGVRDEAEIRGHRRTYIGAMPGRILQAIQQAGSNNPVFMLDEIDKLGSDFRGDPSSALLEVLDPEHNSEFSDHYLGVPYDLSKVLFITTANLLEPIQPAFLDRLEVLRLTGYTEEEKVAIARQHLIPKQLEAHGLKAEDLRLTTAGIRTVISDYTREAGLRNLERELAALCRKVAVRVADGQRRPRRLAPARIRKLLGPARHFSSELLDRDRIGVATGVAWTATGGDLIFIEVTAVPGKGQLLLTGQLGDVMKESAQTALSYARAYAVDHGGPEPGYFTANDLHIHVPAGSIPKDGPSAGITVATAVISLLTSRPVSRRVAMTGELTLRGNVLPIGGVREKVMAARLAGVQTLIVPKLNQRDLDKVPAAVRKGLDFRFAEHLEEVLEIALLPAARPGG